jgi:hypothetical protein
MKKILITLALPIYVFIAQFIIALIVFCGLKAGWGWFLFVFSELIFFAGFFAAMFYEILLEKLQNSYGAALYSAIIVTIWNLLNLLHWISKIEKKPLTSIGSIIINIVVIIYVIHAAVKRKQTISEQP